MYFVHTIGTYCATSLLCILVCDAVFHVPSQLCGPFKGAASLFAIADFVVFGWIKGLVNILLLLAYVAALL